MKMRLVVLEDVVATVAAVEAAAPAQRGEPNPIISFQKIVQFLMYTLKYSNKVYHP